MDFNVLFGTSLTNRKSNTAGNKFNWREMRRLRYDKNIKGVSYKTSLAPDESFKSVMFAKRGKFNETLLPKLAYLKSNPIREEKKQHLIDILPYISESLWDFYRNFKTEKDTVDTYPNVSSSEDDEN